MRRRCSTDVQLYSERRLLKRCEPQAKVAAAQAAAVARAAATAVAGGVKVRIGLLHWLEFASSILEVAAFLVNTS
jgi:hypothetical protein